MSSTPLHLMLKRNGDTLTPGIVVSEQDLQKLISAGALISWCIGRLETMDQSDMVGKLEDAHALIREVLGDRVH